MAPTLVGTPDIKFFDDVNATSLVSAAITVAVGDILVIKVVTADVSAPCTGVTVGGVAATSRATSAVASNCAEYIFTFPIVSGTTATVTSTFTGSGWRSMVTEVWRGAQLAGTPATNATKNWAAAAGGFSASLTTVANSSIVTWCAGDWNAVAFGTIAYRSSATSDGATSNRGGDGTNYSSYFAYQDAVTAGTQTFGTTSPAGSATFSAVGIEIQDAGGGPPPTVMTTPLVREFAIQRAARW